MLHTAFWYSVQVILVRLKMFVFYYGGKSKSTFIEQQMKNSESLMKYSCYSRDNWFKYKQIQVVYFQADWSILFYLPDSRVARG